MAPGQLGQGVQETPISPSGSAGALAYHPKLRCGLRSGRIRVQASLGKVSKTPTQQKKARHGGAHLSPQLVRNLKYEGHDPGQSGQKARPHLQNNQIKKDYECGSSSRAPALQVFKLQHSHPKKQVTSERNHLTCV
jgi:hypothetical protein